MEFDNLITSPFGLGEKLILELLKKGESVYAVFPTPKDVPMSFLGKKNIKYGFLKFDHDPILEKVLPRRTKRVFHISELYSGRFSRLFKSNTLATLLLLEWAKNAGVEHFIYLSSGEVYGKGTNLDENHASNPYSFYATSKYQAEMFLRFYQRFYRIHTIRLFFPFGKGVEQGFVWNIAQSLISEDTIDAEYDNISPTFTDDVVEPLIRLREQKDSDIYNVCGSPVKLEKVVEELKKVVQKSPKTLKSRKVALSGNNSKAKESLKYSETSLPEAMKVSFGG